MIEENPTDRYLIEQYRSGNTSVLSLLVKKWHKVFCQRAFWVLQDKEMAKDVAQESWLVIIAKLHNLKNLDSFKSWAFRIIYTKAIDVHKRRIKDNAHLKSVAINDVDQNSDNEYKIKVRKTLLRAIQQLPTEKQDVIRLFYVEEYSIKEIGDFLEIPQGTVKSRLFKAREKLKSLIKEERYEK